MLNRSLKTGGIVECSNSFLELEVINLIRHQVKGLEKPDKEEWRHSTGLLKVLGYKSESFPEEH